MAASILHWMTFIIIRTSFMLIISSSTSFSFSSYVAGRLGGSSKEDLLRSDSARVDRNTGDGRGGGQQQHYLGWSLLRRTTVVEMGVNRT